jgi:hypothetical protein
VKGVHRQSPSRRVIAYRVRRQWPPREMGSSPKSVATAEGRPARFAGSPAFGLAPPPSGQQRHSPTGFLRPATQARRPGQRAQIEFSL